MNLPRKKRHKIIKRSRSGFDKIRHTELTYMLPFKVRGRREVERSRKTGKWSR